MNVWQELRRRRVFRVAGLYIVGAWVVIQVADVLFPAWDLPETALRYLFIAAAAGFPVALIFGWFYDITPQGIVRTEPAGHTDAIDLSLKRTDYVILVALLAMGIAILYGSLGGIREEIESGPAVAGIERRDNSIAVLPFTNLDVNPDTGYFSDGVTEEILHRLSTLGALHVLASTSSFAFRDSDLSPADISRRLGVRFLLQGSVRRDADHVRVTARLLDETGFQLWSDSFDRKLEGIFTIQTEIASAVSSHVISEIVPMQELPAGRTTENMEAYNAYLLGRDYLGKRTTGWREEATAAFRRAIELDPDYAPPYAGLAAAIAVNTGVGPQWQEGRALAKQAVALDPDLAEAHATLGLMQSILSDHESGLLSLRRAIELDPSLAIAYTWIAHPLNRLERHGEAVAAERRGLEVDPLNPVLIRNVAFDESRGGDFARAEQLLLRLADLVEPPERTFAWLNMVYDDWGRYAQAVDTAKQSIRTDSSPSSVEALALAYANLGSFDQADYWYDQFRGLLPDDTLPIASAVEFGTLRGERSGLTADLQQIEAILSVASDDDAAYLLYYGGLAYIQGGDFAKGIEYIEHGLALYQEPLRPAETTHGIDIVLLDKFWDPRAVAHMVTRLAYAYQQSGRIDDATALLTDLDTLYPQTPGELPVNPASLEYQALRRALSGDAQGALEALQQAVDLGWANYYGVTNDPAWAKTIARPEFQAVLAKAKSELDRQRAIVEAADAEHDFRAEVEELLRSQSSPP